MPEATLTFEIGGRVELKDLSEGITLFERLVSSLTPRAGVTWVVEDLRAGSATATLRGEANSPAVLERVIADYEEIGRCLSLNRTPIHDSERAVKAARDIAAFANRLEYVRFETPSQDYLIYGNGSADADIPTSPLVSVGAITGRVQTLSSRSGLKFTMYDDVLDRAVACYLEQGQEDMMREAWEAWGRRATVAGRVSRNPATGVPLSMRDIVKVDILEDAALGTYREARGAVPLRPGDMLPEEAIRILRDA